MAKGDKAPFEACPFPGQGPVCDRMVKEWVSVVMVSALCVRALLLGSEWFWVGSPMIFEVLCARVCFCLQLLAW